MLLPLRDPLHTRHIRCSSFLFSSSSSSVSGDSCICSLRLFGCTVGVLSIVTYVFITQGVAPCTFRFVRGFPRSLMRFPFNVGDPLVASLNDGLTTPFLLLVLPGFPLFAILPWVFLPLSLTELRVAGLRAYLYFFNLPTLNFVFFFSLRKFFLQYI